MASGDEHVSPTAGRGYHHA
ncbi:hypothetical protein LINPERPRIM_LOCUS15277 [Linum perenne]